MAATNLTDVTAISRRDGAGFGDGRDWWVCLRGNEPQPATDEQVSDLFKFGNADLP